MIALQLLVYHDAAVELAMNWGHGVAGLRVSLNHHLYRHEPRLHVNEVGNQDRFFSTRIRVSEHDRYDRSRITQRRVA